MEKAGFVDQKAAARFERVRSQVLARAGVFATQGSVVAGWRTFRGRRLGPYFRVAYREQGRQRSIYMGRSEELARRVRELLAGLQRRHRQRRLVARLQAQVRSSLRLWMAGLRVELAEWGIHVKGFEFRGAVRAIARRARMKACARPRTLRSAAMGGRPAGRDERVRASTHPTLCWPYGVFSSMALSSAAPLGP